MKIASQELNENQGLSKKVQALEKELSLLKKEIALLKEMPVNRASKKAAFVIAKGDQKGKVISFIDPIEISKDGKVDHVK